MNTELALSIFLICCGLAIVLLAAVAVIIATKC